MKIQTQAVRLDGEANTPMAHPLRQGQLLQSPGGHFTYRVIGPCCRLFDREQLPWPCCRLQWRGKEPSWRRIGRRLIADLATRNYASYCVEIVGQPTPEPLVITVYWFKLPGELRDWWYSDRLKTPPDPLHSTIAEVG